MYIDTYIAILLWAFAILVCSILCAGLCHLGFIQEEKE